MKCISDILQSDIKVKWQVLLETWICNLNFQDSFQTCIRLRVQWNTPGKNMLLIHEWIMQTWVSASKQTFPKLFLPPATINSVISVFLICWRLSCFCLWSNRFNNTKSLRLEVGQTYSPSSRRSNVNLIWIKKPSRNHWF